ALPLTADDSGVEAGSERFEFRLRAAPFQFLYIGEQWKIGPECGKSSEKQGAIALGVERFGERSRTGGVDLPFAPIFSNCLNVAARRSTRGGRLGAPSGQSGVRVGGVPGEGEIVGDGFGGYTEFLNDALLVEGDAGAAVQLDDAGTADALAKVFVGGADDDA